MPLLGRVPIKPCEVGIMRGDDDDGFVVAALVQLLLMLLGRAPPERSLHFLLKGFSV
jgi:hypothetical protein